jgi:hypothetical protein
MSLFCPLAFGGNLYTLADLEVLVREEGHREFFAHALDVRPSERQEAWRGMVTKMGDRFGQRVLGQSTIDRSDFRQIEELYGWPVLRGDDVFKLRRRDIGLRYLRQCLKQDPPCWEELRAFWEKDKTDADTAFKLAELTRSAPEAPVATWSFLEVALKSNLAEFFCKKDFALEALWGKIEIDYVRLGPEGDLMRKIDETVHPDCLPPLVAEARRRLARPPKAIDRELAFQVLKSQGKATPAVTDFFYTVYLLDNPAQGELFNLSWNRVRELGGTAGRREAVLKLLRELDPLPDGILASLDQTKKRVVLRHFKTYFPEYFDFYADQCVSYYGGKGAFPAGNPTVHCQDLMSSDLAPQILDEFRIKKFQDVRRI